MGISARGKVRYLYDFGFELKFTFIFAATGDDSNNKDKGDDSNDDDDDDDDEGVRGILQSLRKPPKDATVKKAYYEMVEKLREKVQQTMQVFTMDFKSQ